MTMEYPWTSWNKDTNNVSSPPARLDFTGFQSKPALSFIRNQAKEQHSCSGRGRNPFTTCTYTSFFCLFFTLTAVEEEPGVPHTPQDCHWGIIQNRLAVKPHLPHVMEKDTSECKTAPGGCCLSAMRKQSQACRENPDSLFGRPGIWKNQGIYPQKWDTLPWVKCWVPDTGNPSGLANT